MNFNPLEHSVCLEYPLWLEETAWAGHIPFGMFLVSALRPRTLVELGAFRGVSYCSFCQAVKVTKSDTKCYAVDTWQGDEHAGKLETGAVSKLRAHHDPLYAEFSRLIQSTFDGALQHFADGSIDLLHIDGFHTFEAVKHDFETWLPKMSDRGVMILHDINVREHDFGVWRFWDELRLEYRHFEFLHSHGLGVLATGDNLHENLQFLFSADQAQTAIIRGFFFALGERIDAVIKFNMQNSYVEELRRYEAFVNDSRLVRAIRIFKNKGAKNSLFKAAKKRLL